MAWAGARGGPATEFLGARAGEAVPVVRNSEAGAPRTVGYQPGRVPAWVARVPLGATGIRWNGGIQDRGLPFEDWRATQLPPGSRNPPGFPRLDFWDEETGYAESTKTLDTRTDRRTVLPESVFGTMKGYVDDVAGISRPLSLSGRTILPQDIRQRVLCVAVPSETTAAQWFDITRAVAYGQGVGVHVRVVVTE